MSERVLLPLLPAFIEQIRYLDNKDSACVPQLHTYVHVLLLLLLLFVCFFTLSQLVFSKVCFECDIILMLFCCEWYRT